MNVAPTLLLLAMLDGASDGETLRAKATELFRAKKYAQACETFEQASKMAPSDAAIAADLALCLQKAGRTEDAIRQNRRAVALTVSAADVQTRKNALYNLAKLGAVIPVPAPGRCAPLSPPPGCARALHACGFEGTVATRVDGTAWVTSQWTAVRISSTSEGAQVADPRPSERPENSILDGTTENQSADVLIGYSPECPDCGDATECFLVEANGCRGVVGLMCTATPRGGKPTRAVMDFELSVPR
jgi:hypothetical protein